MIWLSPEIGLCKASANRSLEAHETQSRVAVASKSHVYTPSPPCKHSRCTHTRTVVMASTMATGLFSGRRLRPSWDRLMFPDSTAPLPWEWGINGIIAST